MDELTMFKALGDETRYAIYRMISHADYPLSATDIATSLKLHPNSVRPHLDLMSDAGLVHVEVSHSGQVGRPRNLYSLDTQQPAATALSSITGATINQTEENSTAENPATTKAAVTTMAAWLVDVAEEGHLPADALRSIGRRHAADKDVAHRDVDSLCEHQRSIGFLATVEEPQRDKVRLRFDSCPVHEMPDSHSEVVCELHKGSIEGFVDGSNELEMGAFCQKKGPEQCFVELRSVSAR